MTDFFRLFSHIFTGSLRVLLGLIFICRLLSIKKNPDRKNIVAGLAVILSLGIFLSLVKAPIFYQIVSEIIAILIAICASRLQIIEIRMCLFISIFYEIGISFWQFLLSAGMGIFFHSPDFLDSETVGGQSAIWLFHALLIILILYLYFPKKKELDNQSIFRAISVITLAGFLAVVILSEQTIIEIPDDTLYMWTILSVILMMSVLVFKINRQYEMEKELAKLKSEQAELLERDYITINHAYEINAKLFHDFHNHIGVLRQLLSREKYRESMEYLDALQAPIREMTDTIWTGDETVDYLINRKAATATENKIQFQAQVEFPHHTNIRSVDLCAILGNLLDNAIEAAQQVSELEQRWVTLTIRRINQMLIIKVENSFLTTPIQENGNLKTTKKESGLHGWGLKSAQTAAEKYDGIVQTDISENIFRAVATLSYHEIELI